jgi:hypothetical protein
MAENKEKNPGGRPLKLQFKSKEELDKAIEEYFDGCQKPKTVIKDVEGVPTEVEIKDAEGNPIMEQVRPFTMSGLAYALGITRETLLEYADRDMFSDSIKKAKARCEQYVEEALFDKGKSNGARFNLINNYSRWKDKTEVDTNVNANVNYENMLKEVEGDEY